MMNKADFIERLSENYRYSDSRQNRILKEISEAENELQNLLEGNEKNIFVKYVELQRRHLLTNEFDSFAEGFRFGASCMLETFFLKY